MHAHTLVCYSEPMYAYMCAMCRMYGGQLVRHLFIYTVYMLTWQNSHEISVCGPSTHTIATITRFGYSILFSQLIARLCRFTLPCRHSVSQNIENKWAYICEMNFFTSPMEINAHFVIFKVFEETTKSNASWKQTLQSSNVAANRLESDSFRKVLMPNFDWRLPYTFVQIRFVRKCKNP